MRINTKSSFVTVTQATYSFTPSDVVDIRNTSNFVVENLEIDGSLYATNQAIQIVDCSNFTIKKLIIKNATDVAIQIERCSNFTIDTIFIDTPFLGGMYIRQSQNGIVKNCLFKNITRQGENARGQAIQWQDCRRCITTNCVAHNADGYMQEDMFSHYNCSKMIFEYCRVRTENTTVRPNSTFGLLGDGSPEGLISGDYWGEIGTENCDNISRYHIGVNPGRSGVSISGGNRNQLYGNKMYSTGTAINITDTNTRPGGCTDSAGIGTIDSCIYRDNLSYWLKPNATLAIYNFTSTIPEKVPTNFTQFNNLYDTEQRLDILGTVEQMVNRTLFERMCLGVN
jgi:hypothetical protein